MVTMIDIFYIILCLVIYVCYAHMIMCTTCELNEFKKTFNCITAVP